MQMFLNQFFGGSLQALSLLLLFSPYYHPPQSFLLHFDSFWLKENYFEGGIEDINIRGYFRADYF
jgi:hypothetical protein